VQNFVARTINGAHAAFTDFRSDVVMAQNLTDHEQFLWAIILGWALKVSQRECPTITFGSVPGAVQGCARMTN
jgi:hypothetical protein